MGGKKGMSVIKIKGTSRSTEPAGGGKEQGDQDDGSFDPVHRGRGCRLLPSCPNSVNAKPCPVDNDRHIYLSTSSTEDCRGRMNLRMSK